MADAAGALRHLTNLRAGGYGQIASLFPQVIYVARATLLLVIRGRRGRVSWSCVVVVRSCQVCSSRD